MCVKMPIHSDHTIRKCQRILNRFLLFHRFGQVKSFGSFWALI